MLKTEKNEFGEFEELYYHANRLKKNPHEAHSILFDKKGELKAVFKKPVNLYAFAELIECLSGPELMLISEQINTDYIHDFLGEEEIVWLMINFPKAAIVFKLMQKLCSLINNADALLSFLKNNLALIPQLLSDINILNCIEDAHGILKIVKALPETVCYFAKNLQFLDNFSVTCTLSDLLYLQQTQNFCLFLEEIIYRNQIIESHYTYDVFGNVIRTVQPPSLENKNHNIYCDVQHDEYDNIIFSHHKSIKTSSIFLINLYDPDYNDLLPRLSISRNLKFKTIMAVFLVKKLVENINAPKEENNLDVRLFKLCRVYLLPFKEIIIDSAKELIHALAMNKEPCAQILIASLLIRAAENVETDKDFIQKGLELIVLDAMRACENVLKTGNQILQQTAGCLLWHCRNAVGLEFKSVHKYYEKIQLECSLDMGAKAVLQLSENTLDFFKPEQGLNKYSPPIALLRSFRDADFFSGTRCRTLCLYSPIAEVNYLNQREQLHIVPLSDNMRELPLLTIKNLLNQFLKNSFPVQICLAPELFNLVEKFVNYMGLFQSENTNNSHQNSCVFGHFSEQHKDTEQKNNEERITVLNGKNNLNDKPVIDKKLFTLYKSFLNSNLAFFLELQKNLEIESTVNTYFIREFKK